MEARGEGAGRTEAGASQTHGAGGPPAGPAGAPRAAGTAALAGATRQAADRGRGSGGRPRSGRGPRGTFSKAAGPGAALLPRAPRGSSLGRGHVCPRAALPGRHGARQCFGSRAARAAPGVVLLSAARLGIPGPPRGTARRRVTPRPTLGPQGGGGTPLPGPAPQRSATRSPGHTRECGSTRCPSAPGGDPGTSEPSGAGPRSRHSGPALTPCSPCGWRCPGGPAPTTSLQQTPKLPAAGRRPGRPCPQGVTLTRPFPACYRKTEAALGAGLSLGQGGGTRCPCLQIGGPARVLLVCEISEGPEAAGTWGGGCKTQQEAGHWALGPRGGWGSGPPPARPTRTSA